MFDFRDITSADAQMILTVAELFPAGIPLQKFSADQSVIADEEVFAEVRMGVDGKLAAGYTPTPKPVTLMLEADSPSVLFMNQIINFQQVAMRTLKMHLIILIPAQLRVFTYTNGVLVSGIVFPALKKVQDPLTYKFQFEKRLIQLS
jgi:hypothetical protein